MAVEAVEAVEAVVVEHDPDLLKQMELLEDLGAVAHMDLGAAEEKEEKEE